MDKLIIGAIVIVTFISYYEPSPETTPSVSVAENRVEAPTQLPRSPALSSAASKYEVIASSETAKPYETPVIASESALKAFQKVKGYTRTVCVHEAGHFYMAMYYNAAIDEISMVQNDSSAGHVLRSPVGVWAYDTRISAAGYAAEMLFIHESTNYQQFLKAAGLTGRKIKRAEDLSHLFHHFPNKAYTAIVQAAEILKDKEDQIMHIAAALYKMKFLDENQCAALVQEIRAMEAQAQ